MIRPVLAWVARGLVMALPLLGAARPSGGAHSAPQAKARAAQLAVPWMPGERLDYRVKFGIFTIGRASLSVLGIDTLRGEPCYHVLFTIRGHALMYTLQDSLQSWFGVNDLESRRFTQHALENGHPRLRNVEIYPGTIWIKNGVDTGATVAQPLDDASFFFYARTLVFEDDSTYEIPRYFEAAHNPVTIKVLGRETTGVPAGRFAAVVVAPVFSSGGMFGKNGQAMIWFSDDDARVPLRIRASMAFGTLDMSLTGVTRP